MRRAFTTIYVSVSFYFPSFRLFWLFRCSWLSVTGFFSLHAVLFVALKHMQFRILNDDVRRREFLLCARVTTTEYKMRAHTSTKSRVCTLYVWIQTTISNIHCVMDCNESVTFWMLFESVAIHYSARCIQFFEFLSVRNYLRWGEWRKWACSMSVVSSLAILIEVILAIECPLESFLEFLLHRFQLTAEIIQYLPISCYQYRNYMTSIDVPLTPSNRT